MIFRILYLEAMVQKKRRKLHLKRHHTVILSILFLLTFATIATYSSHKKVGAEGTPCSYADPADPNGGVYNEPRLFLESQAWWMNQTGEMFPGRHIHVSTCFPWAGLSPQPVLTGDVPFNIKVQLHNQPINSYIKEVRIQIATKKSDGGITVADKKWTVAGFDNTCLVGDCTFWFPFTINTALSDRDGLEEFRFQVFTKQPDGTEQLATTGWQAQLKNGKTVENYRADMFYNETRGWYTNYGYENTRLTSTFPLPSTPVPDTWTTNWKLDVGSGGTSVTHVECSVDPDYHNGSNGTVVFSKNGSYTGPVTVDTRNLANGTHKLVCRTDAVSSLKTPKGTNTGVFAIRFTKLGPTPTSTLTPTPTDTPTPTMTPTETPTDTPTILPTDIPSLTPIFE